MGGVGVHINDDHDSAVLAAAKLKAVGDRALRMALKDAIEAGTNGLDTALRASALARLPRRNGLAEAIAASSITRRRQRGKGVGVVFTIESPYNAAGLDRGKNIHPLFGNKSHWYAQRVHPNWITAPLRENGPRVASAIDRRMEAITRGLNN